MASDLSGAVRDVLGNVVRDALKNAGGSSSPLPKKKGGPFSGARGVAAGAGLAAAAPLAKKGYDKFSGGGGLGATKVAGKAASKAGDSVGSKLKDTVSEKVDEAGGASGLVKEAAGGLLPGGGGGDGGGNGGLAGVGKGRRMPVQQHVDVAVPVETAYNQWTQFEDWPEFMHRVTRVTQDDDCTVKFATKIWGKTKEFEAKIETQRPDERIKWSVAQGITHAGVVTFHELAPNLTRIEVNLDISPGSLIEKAARGMRHIKRAVRADLHRFKAYIEMQELETGAWRGVIEDGELVEPHDDSYDEERDYSEVDDLENVYADSSDDDDEDSDEDEDDDSATRAESDDDEQDESTGGNGHSRGRGQRFQRQAARATSARSPSRSPGASSSGSSKRAGSRSGSSGSSSRKPAAKRTASKPAAKRTASKASSSSRRRPSARRRRRRRPSRRPSARRRRAPAGPTAARPPAPRAARAASRARPTAARRPRGASRRAVAEPWPTCSRARFVKRVQGENPSPVQASLAAAVAGAAAAVITYRALRT